MTKRAEEGIEKLVLGDAIVREVGVQMPGTANAYLVLGINVEHLANGLTIVAPFARAAEFHAGRPVRIEVTPL